MKMKKKSIIDTEDIEGNQRLFRFLPFVILIFLVLIFVGHLTGPTRRQLPGDRPGDHFLKGTGPTFRFGKP